MKNIHPYALRLPASLWSRLQKITGGYSVNVVIGAAIMFWLLLDADERAAYLNDYMATKGR